jgi:hypothetical protein
MVLGVPQASGHGAVKGERHDEQQAGEAVRVLDLRVLDAEAA